MKAYAGSGTVPEDRYGSNMKGFGDGYPQRPRYGELSRKGVVRCTSAIGGSKYKEAVEVELDGKLMQENCYSTLSV